MPTRMILSFIILNPRLRQLLDLFDDYILVNLVLEHPFDSLLDRHRGVRTAPAGAGQAELDIGVFNRDDFKVAAVGLEHFAQFFKFRPDFLFHFLPGLSFY